MSLFASYLTQHSLSKKRITLRPPARPDYESYRSFGKVLAVALGLILLLDRLHQRLVGFNELANLGLDPELPGYDLRVHIAHPAFSISITWRILLRCLPATSGAAAQASTSSSRKWSWRLFLPLKMFRFH